MDHWSSDEAHWGLKHEGRPTEVCTASAVLVWIKDADSIHTSFTFEYVQAKNEFNASQFLLLVLWLKSKFKKAQGADMGLLTAPDSHFLYITGQRGE